MSDEEKKDTIKILEDNDISTIEMAENMDLRTYQIAVNNLLELYNKQKSIIEAYENKTKEIKSNADNDLDMGSKEFFTIMNIVKEFEKIEK